jgi:hypothetical protein
MTRIVDNESHWLYSSLTTDKIETETQELLNEYLTVSLCGFPSIFQNIIEPNA